MSRARLPERPADFGLLLESFVYNELRKQAVWMDEPLGFYHYRDKDRVEVDVIIENASGDCFAVEVKAAVATLNVRDFSGLKRFRDVAGRRFRLGVLLYDGDRTTAFGERLFAVPVGALRPQGGRRCVTGDACEPRRLNRSTHCVESASASDPARPRPSASGGRACRGAPSSPGSGPRGGGRSPSPAW